MGRVTPILRFFEENKNVLVLAEIHQGPYGSHIGGRAMAHKLLKAY